MKGAPDKVHDHIYKTFVEDCHARYFVTSRKKKLEQLDKDGLQLRGQLTGHHSMCSSTMALFFYSKVVGGKVSPSYGEFFPSVSSLQVKEAFNFCGKFHNTKQKQKKILMEELIKRVRQVK